MNLIQRKNLNNYTKSLSNQLLLNDLIPISRSTKDIGVFGPKGVGKSSVLVLLAFLNWYLFDYDIYSNISLSFPYYHISNLQEFDEIKIDDRKKVFIGDDFDFWFESRAYNTKINKQLNEILIFWGKKSCSSVYSSKRAYGIDKALRESTIEFWNVSLKQKIVNENPRFNNILKKYLNFLYINVDRYNLHYEELKPIIFYDITPIKKLFESKEIIPKL